MGGGGALVGDNIRIWDMHCLNLGKSHRIN